MGDMGHVTRMVRFINVEQDGDMGSKSIRIK